MIHDRVSLVETFSGDDVLVMNPLVLETWPRAVAMEPDVMLPRHVPEFLVIRHVDLPPLEISSAFLFFLQGFKQRLEISFPETLRAFALNDLEEQSRPILNRLGKNLEQIAFVIAIDQNPKTFQRSQVFIDVTD